MKFVMIAKTSMLIVLLSVVGLRPGWCQDTETPTLKGVTSVSVTVGELRPDVEHDGLTRAQLQTDVEMRLRQSGIVVNSATVFPDLLQRAAIGDLHVVVSPVKAADGASYVYSATVQLKQPVVIPRTGELTMAATWSTGSVGMVGVPRFGAAIREVVQNAIDKFINAFRSVNPKP